MRLRISAMLIFVMTLAVSDAHAATRHDLPYSKRTPGALNSAVTQATIHSTICVSGYTSTIRPTSSYTTGLKRQQLASGYALNGDQETGDYEEDHLISLELGGSPDDPKNLWPEPYNMKFGARVKDRVENRLHTLVCNGTITLRAAQRAIATDWENAYKRYIGPLPSGTGASASTREPAIKSTKAPIQSASPPAGATAHCRDGSWSFSQSRSGTCSRHGGVAKWL